MNTSNRYQYKIRTGKQIAILMTSTLVFGIALMVFVPFTFYLMDRKIESKVKIEPTIKITYKNGKADTTYIYR